MGNVVLNDSPKWFCVAETVQITNTIVLFFSISSTPLADLYSLSYFWISGVSFGAAFIVGLIASFAFGNNNKIIVALS